MTPNYKQIYTDIITKKFPDKQEKCQTLLNKDNLSALNIIELNTIIFGAPDKRTENLNQKFRSYKRTDILRMLDYQKKYKLNNKQLALHFSLSRNTVTKWRNIFQI